MSRSWKVAVGVVAAVVVVVVGVMVGRAATVDSKQADVEAVEVDIDDPDGAVDRFARSLEYPTIAPEGPDEPTESFDELREMIEAEYPVFHREADRRMVGELTPHYTIEGVDDDRPEVVFLAHKDVVPVEEDTRDDWEYPPFSGTVADGFIWGRGALDNKHNMMAMLEALERRLAEGEEFERTVHFVFGHDEEIGGRDGARQVARDLEERDVEIEVVYDEGLVITDGMVPGIDEPVGLVGVAERGYASLEVVAEGREGHASMPADDLAVVRLAEALTAIGDNPPPASLEGPIAEMFEWLVAEMSFGYRMVFRNLWLLEPVVLGQLTDAPGTNAVVRTTVAPTMLRGAERENVLPGRAVATLNVRLDPGDEIDDIVEYLEEVVDDDRVAIEVADERRGEASPVAPTEGPAFEALQGAFGEVFADTPLAPGLLTGATDSRHFTELTPNIYRFTPVVLDDEDLDRIHGMNERLSVEAYLDLIRYYERLFERW